MDEVYNSSFPGFITELPLADIPVEGMSARLLQADGKQVLFMEFLDDVSVPEHSHEAQWGAVLDGEMTLSMNGETLQLKKGDTYFIPRGAEHSARIKRGYKDVVVFDQPDRYSSRGKR